MSDRFSMELVSVGLITILLVVFSLPFAVDAAGQRVQADLLLRGFGNSALITIMALLVVGQALFQTGALDGPSRRLLRSYDHHPRMTLVGVFLAVFVTSAFINNTPVVVMFLPIMGAIAQRMGTAPSRLLIPLSFVSVLAGMTTLIGSSTNLLAADKLTELTNGQYSLGFFQQAPVGLLLGAVGMLYILVFAPILLPQRDQEGSKSKEGSGKQFIAQIEISRGHPMQGHTAVAGMFPDLPNITVRMIQRGGETFLPPFEEMSLSPGDLVIVAATRKSLTEAFSRKPKLLHSIWYSNLENRDPDNTKAPTLSLTEAIVAPGSRLIQRQIDTLGHADSQGAVVLGVQRRSRMIRARLGEIRLEAGDTLLLCGTPEALDDLRPDRDLLLLDWSRTDLPDPQKAVIARTIALSVVIAAAFGLTDILIASLLGAVAMIATNCLNIRQAVRALDIRIFLLIGAALAMGTALQVTGAADFIAQQTVAVASPYGPVAILSLMFLVIALVTNVLSNSATAVIFTPIAISTANEMGLDPVFFVLTVIYASNCAFATPIAYQTNLLVMGPGHYRFSDFLKFGTPLVLLLWFVFSLYASWRIGIIPA
ncbi:MAG: SLC13 family permease [Hirschia sp.]|nr:SLC13 family permease [Hirschia sp.]MBF17115.1 SLC13 family permease [Hirschia sp.]